MSAWHEARETWATADEQDIEFVVRDRLPDWGLTRRGRRIAAQQLTERDASAEEIAELIGVTPRTVYRWRAEGFQEAAA
ncbi:helix-turn-helix domain-containing protein [Streptomyces rochei]|uniref:helix-turn-helix domain-containing protein n=1 Tax=Streptomyces rochei TaxID=1928 RepID=UPI00367AE642